jgi:hypothetical protein
MSAEPTIHAHSHQYFLDLQLSTKAFYDEVEKAVRDFQFPDVKFSRTDVSEGGLFSSNREYLCIKRKAYSYQIGAFPFGRSFFVSWWLKEDDNALADFLAKIPIIGRFLARQAVMKSYYQIDTELMFSESMKAIMNMIVNKLAAEKGYRLESSTQLLD